MMMLMLKPFHASEFFFIVCLSSLFLCSPLFSSLLLFVFFLLLLLLLLPGFAVFLLRGGTWRRGGTPGVFSIRDRL